MLKRLPNLTWLRSFEASARLLSFTAAAEELGLTQAAVSLQMRSLESKLGCALFLRRPRKLALTDMGRAYLPAVRRALEDLSLSTSGLFGPNLQRAITVRAPTSTAALWLAPLLIDFQRQQPGVELRLLSANWADAINDAEVDIDIRLGIPQQMSQRCEWLSDESIVPICSAGLGLREPEELLQQPLIHILGYEDNWQRYYGHQSMMEDNVQFVCTVDTSIAALEMVAVGAGVATVITRFADSAIAAGRGIIKVGKPMPFELSHFLIEPSTARPERHEVRAFKMWLRKCFAATP